MAETQERLKWLSELLDEKASRLREHQSLEERNQLLRGFFYAKVGEGYDAHIKIGNYSSILRVKGKRCEHS